MIIGEFEIDINSIVSIIKNHKFSHIMLQLPDGLKFHSRTFIESIEKKVKVKIYISADSCFGACDIPCPTYTRLLGIDAIFQIGHTPIPSMDMKQFKIPMFFINAQATCNIEPVIEDSLNYLVGKSILIVTTAQHLHQLPKIVSFLTNHGLNPIVRKGDDRLYAPGQILGCNTSVIQPLNSFDSILYIGSGMFHPIALLLSTDIPVIAANPFTNRVEKESLKKMKDNILRKRYVAIARAQQSHKFGILISTKLGQQQLKKAEDCKRLLEQQNKEVSIFTIDNISPYLLDQFPHIDCFISTACPRIAIDDASNYSKPLLTAVELSIAFGVRFHDAYQFDEI